MSAALAALDLWPHQRAALERLLPLRAGALWMGMGAGKSRVALEIARGHGADRVLVLCPKSVINQWGSQAAQWLPETPTLLLRDGPVVNRAFRLNQFKAGVVVLNYDVVPMPTMLKAIRAWKPDMLVLDECHRLKKPGGARSRAVANLPAIWRLGLSGTPLAHSPLDAYGVYRALDPGVFGTSFTRFKLRYTAPCSWGQQDGVAAGFGGVLQPYRFVNQDELHRRMMSIAYQVNTRDVLDLPPESDAVREVELEPEARAVYRKLDKELVADLRSGQVTALNALTRLLRLQEITGGSVHDDAGAVEQVSTAKERELAEYFDDLPPEEPTVVFCRFRADLAAVHRSAAEAGRESLELSGSQNQLEEWLAEGAPSVLAVQIQAGSLGIELHRAAYAVFYSLGYSLSEYLQARARLVRPDQTRPVHFTHLIAQGTVDQEVYAALERREAVIESVLRAMQQ